MLKTIKYAALAGCMAWTVFVAFDVRAEDSRPGERMICPDPWSIENNDFSRCHKVPADRKVVFGSALCSLVDMMAEVCNAEGKDCYTGYASAAQW